MAKPLHSSPMPAAGIDRASLNRMALNATVHCLTGCSIGEVLGMVMSTAMGWTTFASLVLSIALAFVFGYALTVLSLLRARVVLSTALALAFASDTLSIVVMETVDSAIMMVVPGAMDAALTDMLFWGSLAVSLVLAGIAAFPANRWLIARGKGHAVIHRYAHHGPH